MSFQPTIVAYLDVPTFTISLQENTNDSIRLLFPYDAKILRNRSIAYTIVQKYMRGCLWAAEHRSFYCSKNLPPLFTNILDVVGDQFFSEVDKRSKSIFSQTIQNSQNSPVPDSIFLCLKKTMAHFAQTFCFDKRKQLYIFNASVQYKTYICEYSTHVPKLSNLQNLDCLAIFKSQSEVKNIILGELLTSENSLSTLVVDNVDGEALSKVAALVAAKTCRIRVLAISFSYLKEWTIFANSFDANNSLQKVFIKADAEVSLGILPFCFGNDNIMSFDFFTDDNVPSKNGIISYIAWYNTFIRSRRFIDYCSNFFILRIPAYVLLRIMYFSFPSFHININKPLKKKLHRYVISRIESIYSSYRAVERKKLQN